MLQAPRPWPWGHAWPCWRGPLLGAPQLRRVEHVESLAGGLELGGPELPLLLRPWGEPRVELGELCGLLELRGHAELLGPRLELGGLGPGGTAAKGREWGRTARASRPGGSHRGPGYWPRCSLGGRAGGRAGGRLGPLADWLESKLELGGLGGSLGGWAGCGGAGRAARLLRHRGAHRLRDELALLVDGLSGSVDPDGPGGDGLAGGHGEHPGGQLGLGHGGRSRGHWPRGLGGLGPRGLGCLWSGGLGGLGSYGLRNGLGARGLGHRGWQGARGLGGRDGAGDGAATLGYQGWGGLGRPGCLGLRLDPEGIMVDGSPERLAGRLLVERLENKEFVILRGGGGIGGGSGGLGCGGARYW